MKRAAVLSAREETMKKNFLFKSFLFGVLALSLFACSRPYSLSRIPSAAAVPYQLKLEFSSALNELYYVFSGPAPTYARFPVNARLSVLLKEQTMRQSSPAATSMVTLKVHIENVTTDFDEIGLIHPEKNVQIAMAEPAVLSDGRFFLADFMGDRDGGGSLPEATHKTIRMRVLLQLEKAGQVLGEKRLEVEHTESHYWYDESGVLIDYYRYSYEPVFDEIYRKVLAETGAFVAQTLGG